MTRVEEQIGGAMLKSHVCQTCFGTWIPHVALMRRANLDAARAAAHLGEPAPDHAPASAPSAPAADAAVAASLTDLAAVVAETDTKKELRCPSCNKILQKDRFHALIPVTIDRCKPCGCSWLDAGEMPMIRRLYAEVMSSTDPKVVTLRQKTAGATSHDPIAQARADARQIAGQPAAGGGGVATLGMLFDLLHAV
jgi:Zn-finger nucleic acid-binding protein